MINVTFLFILLLVLMLLIFTRSAFNINCKGFRKYAWYIIAFSVLGELHLFASTYDIGQIFPHTKLLWAPFLFLLGPWFYFLLKNKPRKSFTVTGKNLVHYIPFAAVFLALLPFYILSGEEKLEFLSMSSGTIDLIYLASIIQQLVYLRISIKRFDLRRVSEDSRWLPWCSHLLFVLALSLVLLFDVAVRILHIGLIGMMATVLWYRNAKIVRRVSRTVESSCSLVDYIDERVRKEKLYTKNDLSLRKLSEILGISLHELSKVLNDSLGVSYNEYINNLRIQEVINLLHSEQREIYTIEAISKMAGFNSLSTFNAAFKKVTGTTPSKYKV